MKRFEGNGKKKKYETISQSIESRVTILNFPSAYKPTLFCCVFVGFWGLFLFVCFKLFFVWFLKSQYS